MAGSRWQDRHWDGHLAHQWVLRAIKRGALTPQPCEECGERITVGHHDSYAPEDRLKVRWLCDSHHRRWHLAHPVDYEVPGPPRKAAPVRTPNRGKNFHRYLKPRARLLREKGANYRQIAEALGVSVATAHAWCAD